MDVSDWIAFLGVIVTIMIPMLGVIMRLNSTITRLNVNMEHQHEDDLRRDHRLDIHGDRLDKHESMLAEHDIRLDHLERRE